GGARRARPGASEPQRAPLGRTRQTATAPRALREPGRCAAARLARRSAQRRRHRARDPGALGRLERAEVMAKKVTLLVGTKNGLFILRGDGERKKRDFDGPQWSPTPLPHAASDPRDGPRYAAETAS